MLTVPDRKPEHESYSPHLALALAQPDPVAVDDPTPALTLDHAIVKDRITTLHQDIDAQFALLAERSGPDIAAIPGDLGKFLAEQAQIHKNSLKSPRRQQLFEHMTQSLFAQSRQRAQALYLQKVGQYQSETVQRQNAELAARALADENLFDDQIQTQYRDLILFNLESTLGHLPPFLRRDRLAAAGAALYRRIIEKRLEVDPERLEPILSSPAVRRALGEKEAESYDRKVKTALEERSLRQTAQEWVDADVGPEEAENKAAGRPASKAALLAHYRRFRGARDETAALTHILNAQSAWAAIKEGQYRHEAVPAWVVHNHPELHETVQALLDAWLANGGAAPEPDYVALVEIMNSPDRPAMWGKLREEKNVHALIRKLGGVESWAFDMASRKLLAKTTPEDHSLIRDLTNFYNTLCGINENPDADATNRALSCYYRDRRQKLERAKATELLVEEVLHLEKTCMAEFAG